MSPAKPNQRNRTWRRLIAMQAGLRAALRALRGTSSKTVK
jgi:hypothetical protein